MKKIISALFAALVLVAITACSSNAQADAVAQKIENNEELTQQDYTVMYKYTIEGADFAIKALRNVDGELTKEKFAELESQATEKFPHMEAFQKVLARVNNKDLDEANQELAKERNAKMRELLGAMLSVK